MGVIISTLLIQWYGWTGFDPIASLFIAVLIAASVFPLVMDTGKVLALDVAHRDVDVQSALAEVCHPFFVSAPLLNMINSSRRSKAFGLILTHVSGQKTVQPSLALSTFNSGPLLHPMIPLVHMVVVLDMRQRIPVSIGLSNELMHF